jgi:polysaccharide deacetylase 2 family uncharacterized protein YibQ
MPKLMLWGFGILLLFALVALGIQAGCNSRSKKTPQPTVAPKESQPEAIPGQEHSPSKKGHGVGAPIAPTPIKPATKPDIEPQQALKPRIALVIDDLGQAELSLVQRLCALNIPMTVAVLPFLPHSHDSARLAKSKGLEVILHMPMEPVGYPGPGKNPGEGAVLHTQSEAEVRDKVAQAMRDIPHAIGMNNHMGSRITPDRGRMAWILEEAKKSRWFFLDSRTEKDTVGLEVARELGLAALERKVFLDDSHNPADMAHQWERAKTLAKQDRYVVVIGHLHADTIKFLEQTIPAAKNGMTFVKASEMAR